MKRIAKWWKDLFCKHPRTTFIRNIYGDEINHVSLSKVYRSWWKCEDCKRYIPKERLLSKEEQGEIIWRKENSQKSVK